jgi:hypothetical protein
VLMSSRLTKKSFVSVSGRLVKTPWVTFETQRLTRLP